MGLFPNRYQNIRAAGPVTYVKGSDSLGEGKGGGGGWEKLC